MSEVYNTHHHSYKNSVYLGDGITLSFRLQPIFSFKDDAISGYEILSLIQGQPNGTERFFRNISDERLLYLFKQQILQLNRSLVKGRIFINIKLACLSIELIEWLAMYNERPLAFEIDCQDIQAANFYFEEIESLDKKLKLLKRHEHQIWLDDFDGLFSQEVQHLLTRIDWDGIKLDKSILWALSSKGVEEFNKIIDRCSVFAGGTIIEGIESFHQFNVSKSSGASFGQGFYWGDIHM
ncbi:MULTISPECIES: EAL domain-containing protein [Aeromonas]|uniref:EAL domain-containing protein n=1 Tax=Aeromonas TaxID=642 RepID=UPI0030D9CACE